MKIKLVCDSGANIHSARKETIDTVKDWGMDEGEWEQMPAEDQDEMVTNWANDRLTIYWEEAK